MIFLLKQLWGLCRPGLCLKAGRKAHGKGPLGKHLETAHPSSYMLSMRLFIEGFLSFRTFYCQEEEEKEEEEEEEEETSTTKLCYETCTQRVLTWSQL